MALKHFIIDLDNNVNKFQLPYPFTYEGDTGFVLIDYKGDVVFVTSTTVKNVEHLFDNAQLDDGIVIVPPVIPSKCNLTLSFQSSNPTRVPSGEFNLFTVKVLGGNTNLVQFKSTIQDWIDANIGIDSIEIKVSATGNTEKIYARLKDCTNQIELSVNTVKTDTDGVEDVIGYWKDFLLITKVTGTTKWLLQTNELRTFYFVRGKNFLDDATVTLIKVVDRAELSNEITGLGGLESSSINGKMSVTWNTTWWESRGYILNDNLEWVKAGTQCVHTAWTPTGQIKCENNVSKIEEKSNCPDIPNRWVNGGAACGGGSGGGSGCVPVNWSNTNVPPRCNNGVSEIQQKSNCETYRWVPGGNACENTSGTTSSNLLILSLEESRKNWVSWESFQNKQVTIPDGYDAVLGFGSPIYSDDPSASDGTHLALKLGYTHICNLTAFAKHLNRYKEENIYLFTQPFQLISSAARRMISLVNAGRFLNEYPSGTYNNSGVWGDLDRLANGGIDYRGITEAGAIKLGEYIYYERAWSLDPATANLPDKNYNINNNQAWYMLDDEQIPYGLGGIGKMNFLGALNKGMKLVAPNVKPVWYAIPMSFFFQTQQKPELVTDQMMQNELLNGQLAFNLPTFKYGGYWFDSGVYVKVPTITSHNKYKKDGSGNFILSSGKRVWNNENFTETIYGEVTEFLGEPHEWIKYLLRRDSDGATLLGREYWDGVPNNPTVKAQYLAKGYTSWGRPNMGDWRPETQLNTEFYYGFANVVICNLIANARVEYGNTDISKFKASSKCLNYVELRLKTEEFTAGGNSPYGRQIGAGLLNFCQLFSYLSGIRAVSLWENGKDYGHDLPQRGSVLYPITEVGSVQTLLDNYSGVTHRTDALVRMCSDLANTNQADWIYIHFTYPIVVQNRQGVISSGIYTGNKFVFIAINPTLNFDETQEITIKIGATNYKAVLNGNGSVHYGVITDLPSGLTNNDFTLSYTTIYNRAMVVSGKVTGNISDSILMGL